MGEVVGELGGMFRPVAESGLEGVRQRDAARRAGLLGFAGKIASRKRPWWKV
ncbi:MAG: hypothetical protein U5Q44_04040 [Dehalococcoidia bacterium]|nr:hypothetical protein [Dehalococcoidia bacterium]